MARVLQASSRMKLVMSASTVEKASTVMAACVNRVLLDLNRRTTRVAAIYAWHSARASTVPMVHRASDVVQALSPSRIAQDASHALPSEARTYLRQEMRVCSVVWAVSRVAI